jgi:hypothetical protein
MVVVLGTPCVIPPHNGNRYSILRKVITIESVQFNFFLQIRCINSQATVHRPGDDPRKECEECGNARGNNVRYYPT